MGNKLTTVMYHYVRDFTKTKYPNIKGLDINDFTEQLLYLKNHYNLISIEEVINSIYNKEKLPDKCAILTFDDGYKDHYEYVMPILNKYKIKGAFYVPAAAVEDNKVLDVNKIHFILAKQTNTGKIITYLKNKLDEYRREYEIKSFDYYYSKLAIPNRFDSGDIIFIKRLLQVELEDSIRSSITDSLFKETLNISEEEFSKELYMNKIELHEMIQHGMHIGCHGYQHFWWDHLSLENLNNDIEKSLIFLKTLGVNMNYLTASYPYGSYSKDALDVLIQKKFKLAFTTEVDIAFVGTNHNLLLPRLDTNDFPKDRNSSANKWYHKTNT